MFKKLHISADVTLRSEKPLTEIQINVCKRMFEDAIQATMLDCQTWLNRNAMQEKNAKVTIT